MSKFIKIVSLLIVISMLFSMLTACSDDESENYDADDIYDEETESKESTDTESESESESESEQTESIEETEDTETVDPSELPNYPENTFPLFSEGEYAVKVVMPDNPTDTEKNVYTSLRNALKNKTKVTVTTTTDYRAEGESRNKNEYVILVGYTNYTESKTVYSKTDVSISSVSIVNTTRLVFCFSTEAEGKALVTKFATQIKTDESGYFWVPTDISIKNTASSKIESVPAYPSSTTKVDCGNDTTMLVAKNTNLTNYNNYCQTLQSSGFKEYSRRDDINGNYYRIYTKNTTAVNVYFTKHNSSTRIVTGPIKDIPTKDVDRTPETIKKASVTFLAQEEATDCGLGIIYRLKNGKFIIFDGGFYLNNNLYKALANLAKGDPIVIAAWFISHPHTDHQDAITAFLEKNASKVKIENFIFNYAPPNTYETVTGEGTNGKTGYGKTVEALEAAIDRYLDRTTKIIKAHTGQVYKFGSDATAEILFTVEDILPNKLDYVNSSSMIVKFNVSGQTLLALADATHTVSTALQNTYGSYLKSNVVQLAHHGTYPGHASLYTKIDADVLFWPSNTANAKAQYSNSAVKEALNQAKDVYLAKGTTVTLQLPYTVKNNKQDFLKSIGK